MARIPIPDQSRASAIRSLFKDLLSTKRLYQSLELNTDYIDRLFYMREDSRTPLETFRNIELKELSKAWTIRANPLEVRIVQSEDISLPNITTFCGRCEDAQPFKPISVADGPTAYASQRWLLAFECQGCQQQKVDYLVARHGHKLTICGRCPLEVVPAPSVIPKKFRDRYSSAIVASNAGQVLAALFLLRVFIEEFWRSTEAVQGLLKSTNKPTGDAMGDAYNATLPADFKSRFPNLLAIYNELSAAMHEAKDDSSELFRSASDRIVEHFEARRLFKISDSPAPQPDPSESNPDLAPTKTDT